MRHIAHLIALLVGYNLGLRVLAVPLARSAPYPHPGLALYGAVLRRMSARGNLKAAAAVNGWKLDQHRAVRACRGIAAGYFRIAPLKCCGVPLCQADGKMHRRLHRLVVVIPRSHLYLRRLAGGEDITGRLYANPEGTIGGQHRRMSGDLAIGCIGHPRLDAIVLIVVLGVEGRRQRDREPPIGVEHALMLLLLGLPPRVIRFAGVLTFPAFRIISLGFILAPPIMRRGMHHVLDFGVGHRFAEEVTRLDGGLNGIALKDALHSRLHSHLVLRLLVFLDVEVARATHIAARELDIVEAQRRIGFQSQIRRHGSMR